MSTEKNKPSILVIEDDRTDYDIICEKLNGALYQIIPSSSEFQKMKSSISNKKSNTIFHYIDEEIINNYKNLRWCTSAENNRNQLKSTKSLARVTMNG